MDAGLVISTCVPNLLPSLAILYGIAIAGNDPVAAAGASVEVMLLRCPTCLAEARAINQIPLAGQAGAPYALTCREPVRSVADLKGKRVRASPAISLAINRDRWLAMSGTEKRAHLRHAVYVVAEMAIGNFILRNREAVDARVKDKGAQIIRGDASITALMADQKTVEMATALAKGQEFEVEGVEALVKDYLAAAEKWRALSAEIGTDIETFSEVPWREVCSKVDPDAL